MNKYLKIKLHICFYILILVIFLFPICKVYAEKVTGHDGKEYTYSETDDGSNGPDVTEIPFQVNAYGVYSIHQPTAYAESDSFKVDEEHHGWRVLEKDGNNYVVLAAATHEFLSNNIDGTFKEGDTKKYPYRINFKRKYNHIHYFHIGEIIEFKFEDKEFDSNNYLGMIVDYSYRATFPQDEEWKYESNVNSIEIFYGKEAEIEGTDDYKRKEESELDGKKIIITNSGIYSDRADQKDLSFLNFYMSVFVNLNHTIGDMFQRMIISSASENYVSDLVYAKEVIEGDKEIGLSLDNGESKGNYLKTIDIPSTAQDKSGTSSICYTKETGIPVIPYDIYSICTNRIDNLDIDFLSVDTKNKSHIWNILRNFVFTFTRITFFMTAVILIVMLIKKAITLVYSTYSDSPKEAAESKTIINIWIKAVIQLVGILIIMFVTTALYYKSIQQLLGEYTSNYIIRLNVTGVYSFNTNIIGLIKYKAMSANLTQAFGRSITYLIISLFSLLWYYIMGIRAILIGILSILAPLTVISVFKDKEVEIGFNFKTWLEIYMIVMWFPLIIVIMLRLILRIT